MPIQVICSCGKKLNAPDTLAGKRAKCPACQNQILIPEPLEVIEDELEFIEELPQKPALTKAPAKATQASPRRPVPRQAATPQSPKPADGVPPLTAPAERFAYLSKQIDSAFTQDRIDPVRTPLGYRLAVLGVSVLMILLPLIYLALIAAVAYGVWYHAVNHTTIFTSGTTTSSANRGKEIAGRFMLYLTPILAGGILILFMLKPLFAKAMPRPGRRSLKQEDEPLLFDFVARVCEAVGSPKPKRIDIDNEVNASASFRSGFRSFLGNDLVLTIGMPLAAGLNMRQFGGVLAHEFGHFAQGAGMRLSFVIRSINFWFHRVVNERDQWDDKLKDWSSSLDLRVGWMLYLARFGVWLTRKLLWCLMMAGHFFSSVLMRQMEFDADRHEARFAGSDAFASTARQLHILNMAENGAMSDLGDFHREGRLGDNLPKLILLNIDQMPAELKTKVDVIISESKTGLFDTHPADSARIQSAKREKTEGIFRLELPAGNLFRDFDQTAKDVTWDFYHEIFGEALDKSDIHPVEGLVERQKADNQTMAALTRFFRSKPLMFRPMPNPAEASKPAPDPKAVENRLREARALAIDHADDFASACVKSDEVDTRLLETRLAQVLLDVGLPVAKADFSADLTTRDAMLESRRKAALRQEKLLERLTPFEAATAARLYSGLRLAQTPAISNHLQKTGMPPDETKALISLFQVFNTTLPKVMAARDNMLAMEHLAGHLERYAESNHKLVPEFKKVTQALHEGIAAVRSNFDSHPYPFDHAESGISTASYILRELPDADNPADVHEAARRMMERLPGLHARVLARLCQIAEAVETQLGLEPLADPDLDPSETEESAED